MRIHIWPSEHWVDDEAWAAIVEVANDAERDVRAHLPALVDDLYLLVRQTDLVIPETGVGTWIADRATQQSGRTDADLVWEAPREVAALAGVRYSL